MPECGHTVALSAKSCPRCGNTSFRHYAGTRDAEEICTYCKGNGYTTRPELYCTSCNGWGKIIVTYDAFDDPRGVTTKNYKWSYTNGPPTKSREFEKLICEISICTISFLLYLILFILSRLNSGTRYQKEWLKQKKQQLKEFR